jgi:hypothetical protein
MMSLLNNIDLPIALSSVIFVYCIYHLFRPLSDRFIYSTKLHAFRGTDFEGLLIAEPFLNGATTKPMRLIEEYGPVFILRRQLAVGSASRERIIIIS